MRFFVLFVSVFALFLGSCASKRVVRSSQRPVVRHVQKNIGTGAPSSASSTGSQYIARYKDIAIAEMHQHGIPASIKLAQAILESGNGNSYLARTANNHFGIKCGGSWKGRSVTHPDDKRDDCFRVYDNPEQSFRDHSQFLRGKRYQKLFALARDDYRGWAKGLKAAGYATNPRYPELLIDLIERHKLYQYDRGGKPTATQASAKAKPQTNIPQETAEKPADMPKKKVAMRIYEVKPSDTLYAISQKYGISVQRLKDLNDLSGDALAVGQLLVIMSAE